LAIRRGLQRRTSGGRRSTLCKRIRSLERWRAHQHTIESLRITIAADVSLVDELQAFKAKRGNAVYEMTGIASETEITELRQLGIELRSILIDWLKQKHSNLLSSLKKKK